MYFRVDVCPEYSNSGICLEHYKCSECVGISGWYDTCVRIEGKLFSTADLLQQLGFDSVQLRDLACVLELRENQAKQLVRSMRDKTPEEG